MGKLTTEKGDINELVQERRNSSALAMELHLSYINPWYNCNKRKYMYMGIHILWDVLMAYCKTAVTPLL